jgi:hypothetical protein
MPVHRYTPWLFIASSVESRTEANAIENFLVSPPAVIPIHLAGTDLQTQSSNSARGNPSVTHGEAPAFAGNLRVSRSEGGTCD